MRFTAIDTSAWEKLKESIVELTDCFNEHFAPPAELPDLLHNGDVCRILNISKRTTPALSGHLRVTIHSNRA